MISWVAMDRIVERQRAADPAYRSQAAGKVLRSDARMLTDEELLAKLSHFGITLDHSEMGRLCGQTLSAEEIAEPLLDQRAFQDKQQQMESDWIWICLSALWQRWFPDEPSFESLDDKIQAGYDLLAPGGATACCRIWLEAWYEVLRLFEKGGMRTISEFDDRFGGSQSLFNWIQDLEDELWNAGLDDRQFLTARIAVCEEGLRRFGTGDPLLTENRRCALAESYYELGETARAEALYREWLDENPPWGWGWIGWSDRYRFDPTGSRDLNRSEQILREGLAVEDVSDRADLLDRLADLCQEQGRAAEAKELRRQAKQRASSTVLRHTTKIDFGAEGVPLSELSNITAMLRGKLLPATALRPKVGRNEPCPCGSGKKFKKCCGS